jgi:serine/threonine protein kinase
VLIEKCPKCGAPLAANTLADTLLMCNRCSGAIVMPGAAGSSGGAPVVLPDQFRARYELGTPLGRGAMGAVLRGKQTETGRLVAIKVLLAPGEPELLARFLREAEILASLEHPNLVQVLDLDQLDGCPVLVTELLEGGTLRQRMAKGGLGHVDVARIVAECCLGLSVVHEANVVHRDLKPENILFDAAGRAKVADLGIAKVFGEDQRFTRTGAFVGTPRYMSPEQVRAGSVVPASDLYAMGVIAYEMLAGDRPFMSENLSELLKMHLNAPPPPLLERVPGLAPAIAKAVERALAKTPEERAPTALAMAAEFYRAAGLPVPAEARAPSTPDSESRRSQIKGSAQRAIASMKFERRRSSAPGSASAKPGEPPPAQQEPAEPEAAPPASASPESTAAALPASPASTPARPAAGARSGPTTRPRGGGDDATPRRSFPPVKGSSPLSASQRTLPPARASRAAFLAAALLVLPLSLFAARQLLVQRPGDPRSVRVIPGVTGAQLRWTSASPYLAEARATPGGATARESAETTEHTLTVSGLPEGAAHQIQLSAGGRPLFPPLSVQLVRRFELPGELASTAVSSDELTARLELPAPVRLVSATSTCPSVSVEASAEATAPLRLTLRGPGIAAGLFDVHLKVETVDGQAVERTLAVPGAAERMRDYLLSARLQRDLDNMDPLISSRRIPAFKRLSDAERHLQRVDLITRAVAHLPAFERALAAPSVALGRRQRLCQVLDDLSIVDRLLYARTHVPDPGKDRPPDSLVAQLARARALAFQFIPRHGVIPPPPIPPEASSLKVFGPGEGQIVPRGPGLEESGAATRMIAAGTGSARDRHVIEGSRQKLRRDASRVRLIVVGRCLASHLQLVIKINGTWRIRLWGTSVGMEASENPAAAWLGGDDELEKKVPRQMLWAEIPAGLLQPGDNRFEITAHPLIKEMGTNTVFCVPTIHEVHWMALP